MRNNFYEMLTNSFSDGWIDKQNTVIAVIFLTTFSPKQRQ